MSYSPDWDFDLLESLIENRGDEVIHEKGIACTCRAQDAYGSSILLEGKPATQRRLDCTQCGGTGWIYRDARVIKGLITGVEAGRNRQLLEMGYAVPGDATFSPSLKVGPLHDFDRITMLYSVPVDDGQTVLRNGALLEDNAMLSLGLDPNEDRLWYYADCVEWCEDEDGVSYTQGVDFVVEEKTIRWIGNKPADGKYYSIKYSAFLEWIVYSTPLTRFDRSRSLGQRVLLRKVHVAAINDYEFDTPAKREEQASLFTTKTTV